MKKLEQYFPRILNFRQIAKIIFSHYNKWRLYNLLFLTRRLPDALKMREARAVDGALGAAAAASVRCWRSSSRSRIWIKPFQICQ